MSGESPAVVLYSSDGIEMNVVSGSAVPTSTRAVLISGRNPLGNALYVPTGAEGNLGIAIMSDNFYVQTAATVTASGSQAVTLNYFGTQEVALVVNVGTVTGGGTITYVIQELDPGDGVTVYGNSATTGAISTAGVYTAVLNITTSSSVKVTWTVSGTFSATIYSTVTSKSTPSTQTVNGSISVTNPSVGSDNSTALTFDTQVGGVTSTTAPTYTTGNLDALSLTTHGQLRIDGVYAAGTTNASAPDTMIDGGYVTAAPPVYTTGQTNALSIDTAGNLRTTNPSIGLTGAAPPADATYMGALVTTAAETGLAPGDMYPLNMTTTGQLRLDGVYPLTTVVATAVDMAQVGGVVTTGGPTYTTGTINALSLDTSGNLRVTGSFNNSSVAAVPGTPPPDATYVGALVTAAAETSLTSGNMYPFNLTTTGQLRIDGVYPLTTAAATAVDMSQVGGAVTTLAPTYTTGTSNALSLTTAGLLRVDGTGGVFNSTADSAIGSAPPTLATYIGALTATAAPTYASGLMEPLSLTLSGQLRIDSVYPAGTTNASAPDVGNVGGYVTATAPTYTTGQLEPLSIDTSGNLRVTGVVTTNKASTSNITTITATTASQTLLASNANRLFASVYNGGTRNAYIVLGASAASTTNYSIVLLTGSYWEIPVDYTGQLNVIWSTTGAAALTGNALVTELTP